MLESTSLAISGSKLRSHIEKKPFTQRIDGIDYTFSMIPKKQNNFVFTNDRFLMVKGIETISYARAFPSNVPLPFRSVADFPKHKVEYPLEDVEHCNTEQEKLIIQFSSEGRPKWEFMCPSKSCAYEWRKRIEIAINQLQRFRVSKMERYEDYLGKKRQDKDVERMKRGQGQGQEGDSDYYTPQKINQSLEINLINPMNQMQPVHTPVNQQQPIYHQPQQPQQPQQFQQFQQPQQPHQQIQPPLDSELHKQNRLQLSNGLVSNIVDVLIKPEEKIPELMPLTLKHTNSELVNSSNIRIETASTFSPNTSQIATLQKLLANDSPESPPLINKSISTVSLSSREQVKADLTMLRRNWLDQLIIRRQQTELLIDFQKYVQKIIEIIISQLYIPQVNKIFPFKEWSREYAGYVVDDLEIEVYFYNEEQLDKKHARERYAAKEFKNYDYFLESMQNEGILLVPFMAMFEYKGFTGMAKTIVANQHAPFANKECLSELDLALFREDARIEPRIMLDENKCKIVAYETERQSLSEQHSQRVFFIERFNQFLPSQVSNMTRDKFVLRPELIQDPSLKEYAFGDRDRQAGPFEIESLIAKQISHFIELCESQEEYFANSKQLSNMMHSLGLNMRHLGLVFKQTHQLWLKRVLQCELAARCIKHFFRFDMQNCMMNQTERNDPNERQTERQVKRVIAFLNIILGSSSVSFNLWTSLNQFSLKHFQVPIWEGRYDDININWLLQALQSHLKIELSDEIHKRSYFRDEQPLAQTDFVRFRSEAKIYNLDFTQTFEEIYDCLAERTGEYFSHLCKITTRETSRGKPYLLLLKEQPIYNLICEYFLYFMAPEEYHRFYSTQEEDDIPSRFAYEYHLNQLKWFFINKPENIGEPVRFITNSGRRWLGENHPVFDKLNRILEQGKAITSRRQRQ